MTAWSLVYDSYQPGRERLREALTTLGNGYFATRGALLDSAANEQHYPATYLAGGYDRLTSTVAGREVENEDLVNLPNWLPLTFRIAEGPWFRMDDSEILAFRQELDLLQGLLIRDFRVRDGEGRTTRIRERRFVSMADRHLAGISLELTAEDWSGPLTLRSGLDGGVINDNVPRYRDLERRHLETLELRELAPDAMLIRSRMRQSRIEVAEAVRTRLYHFETTVEGERRLIEESDRLELEIRTELEKGRCLTVEKILALYSSRDQAISEPALAAADSVALAPRFEKLLERHRVAWRHLWDECNIEIEADEAQETALKLRLHIFHLLQTVSPHSIDQDVGVPARGWHGEAYRGHVFWDELFIFPFLNLRLPMLTRALLRYRHRRLPEARRAARAAGLEGALYPWQSGSDGREESQRLHLNPKSGRWIPDDSYRQRHINIAVAYNVWHYFEVTDDHEFLYFYGAEMLLEIARLWASLAVYNPALDRYEIKGVMGPDEYHTGYPGGGPAMGGGLENNAYTNVMAAWVMDRARDVMDYLPEDHCRQLCEEIGLDPAELVRWEEISRKLRVPFHDEGIVSQFEGYERLKEFDWEGYSRKYGDIQRLDRILEAEGDSPNHYKASKQADVLMLFYLLSADELALLFEQLGYPFDRGIIPRNIDYYLGRTSHGSTLSRVVHSWVLARSQRHRSWSLFQEALDSDVADVQGGTTAEGIHLGAMAGTVDIVQRCYGGIETRANVLHLDPVLPDDLRSISFTVRYRRQKLDIVVNHDCLKVSSRPLTASPVTIAYRGHYRELAPGECYTFRLLKPEERDRDENRATLDRGRRQRA